MFLPACNCFDASQSKMMTTIQRNERTCKGSMKVHRGDFILPAPYSSLTDEKLLSVCLKAKAFNKVGVSVSIR